MPSRCRERGLSQDLAATLFRVGITGDNSEIVDLLPEQLREMAAKYPADSIQRQELDKLIAYKQIHHDANRGV